MPKNLYQDTGHENKQLAMKRKWQIALRRYLTENNPSVSYAPYFALPAVDLRKWVELQFRGDMNWENFGKRWNLTQRVPASLFDLADEKDRSLCWHFINVAVQDLESTAAQVSKSIFSTTTFFTVLFEHTGNKMCKAMVDRIGDFQSLPASETEPLELFIKSNEQQIQSLTALDPEDFTRINRGENLQDILMEKEIIKKYGS